MTYDDEYTGPPPHVDDPQQHDHRNVTPLRTTNLTDPESERALLGALLLEPALAAQLHDHIDADDFNEPKHEQIWEAIHHVRQRDGITPDALMVAERLRTTGDLVRLGGAPYLHTLIQACPTPGNATYYAARIRNAARLRRLNTIATKLSALATSGTHDTVDLALSDALDALDDAAARVGPRHQALIRVPTIDDILEGDDTDDDYAWVIPGLLEHQERVIITAEEGAGKSTLLRQIAVTASAGIHPFTGERIHPVRVLHVDVENTLRQSRRQYRPLRIKAGADLDPDRLRIELRTEGIDLTSPDDVEWLTHTVAAARPDILLIGPIYKLANGDPTEEKSAKPVAIALDKIRAVHDCAILLEAHAPKAAGGKKRPHEPYGWSGWMRWPEIGLWLDTDGKISPWRGAREERDWPKTLERGGEWPWSPGLTTADTSWIAIQKARVDAGHPLTQRELEQLTGLSKSTIHRLIGNGGRYSYGWPGFNNSRKVGDHS